MYRFLTRLVAVTGLVFQIISAAIVVADDSEDHALLTEALDAFEAGEFEEAITQLGALPDGSTYAASAAMVAGSAFNRMSSHRLAVTMLGKAEEAGYEGDQLNLEVGWAWLELGESALASLRLQAFLDAYPNHAKATELFGRALAAGGEIELGIEMLNRAKALDPGLADTVYMQLGALAFQFGNSEIAAQQISFAAQQQQDSPIADYLREQFAQPTVAVTASSALAENYSWWGLQAYSGYNDNAIGRGRNQPLPLDISNEGTGLIHVGANAGHRHVLSDRSDVYGVLNIGTDQYFDVSDLNNLVIRGNGQYRYRLDNDGVISFGGFFEKLNVDSDTVRDSWSINGGYDVQIADDQSIDARLTYGKEDYDFDHIFAFRDRDGNNLNLALRYTKQISDTSGLQAGTNISSYNANGDDYDGNSWAVFGQLSQRTEIDIGNKHLSPYISVYFSYRNANYDNLNSFAGTSGFEFERDETQWLANLGVNVPLDDSWSGFA